MKRADSTATWPGDSDHIPRPLRSCAVYKRRHKIDWDEEFKDCPQPFEGVKAAAVAFVAVILFWLL